jgi:hypothetical protein
VKKFGCEWAYYGREARVGELDRILMRLEQEYFQGKCSSGHAKVNDQLKCSSPVILSTNCQGETPKKTKGYGFFFVHHLTGY